MKKIQGGVTAPKGFSAAGVACGIKKSGAKDLAIVKSDPAGKAVCLFTTNKVKAAPVLITMDYASAHGVGAAVINSGNANACTGEQGMKDAIAMRRETAAALGLDSTKVLVSSTGIIGVNLPMDDVLAGIKDAAGHVTRNGGKDAAEAIMTTDTRPKESAVEFEIGKTTVRIGGMAKGSGMIAPNMATMIAVITTDADICLKALNIAVRDAADESFNCITVDGDMSTNDTVQLMANGAAGNTHIVKDTKAFEVFKSALTAVMADLAEQMVRDGEGATKFIKVMVDGAIDDGEAKAIGLAVANSLLVKCAFFGEDANWGRIAAAAGSAPADIDPDTMEIRIGGEPVYAGGTGVIYCAESMKKAITGTDVVVTIDVRKGNGSATVLTNDLTYEYVKINAHYRT